MLFFFLRLACSWKASGADNNVETKEFILPVSYNPENSKFLALKVARVNSNTSGTPILYLGPGNGFSNIPPQPSFFKSLFPNNPTYMIGYRGIDSNVSLIDKHISVLSTLDKKSVDTDLIKKLLEKTQKDVKFTDFWIKPRVNDIISIMKATNINEANILAIGEAGSFIARELLAQNPDLGRRTIFISPSISAPHNDSVIRLLAVYRKICRYDPTCPYASVRWIPEDLPKSSLLVFSTKKETLEYVAAVQLKSPSTAPTALELLQSITDGSSLGAVALSNFASAASSKTKWTDSIMHICSKPRDVSLTYPKNFELLCNHLPEFTTSASSKITTPVLIISGELDLPRPNSVINFFRNESEIPSLIDHLVIPKANARYELRRPDLTTIMRDYFNKGEANLTLGESDPIVWTSKVPVVTTFKWTLAVGFVITIIGSAFAYMKSMPSKKTKQE